MNLLKARVFLQKHKKIIIVSELGILFVILFLLCKSINKELVINNPTMFGVLGTLLGAIIGGVFSLMGSVWVNSKQQRVAPQGGAIDGITLMRMQDSDTPLCV